MRRTIQLLQLADRFQEDIRRLKRLEQDETGLCAGPLRPMAHEVYARTSAEKLSRPERGADCLPRSLAGEGLQGT